MGKYSRSSTVYTFFNWPVYIYCNLKIFPDKFMYDVLLTVHCCVVFLFNKEPLAEGFCVFPSAYLLCCLYMCINTFFVRNRMSLSSTQAFYLIVNNKSLASMSMTMAEVYKEEKDEDGFLYMVYASQEMFGSWQVQKNSKHTLIAVNYVAFHLQHLLHSSTGTTYLNLDVIYMWQSSAWILDVWPSLDSA